MPTGPTASARRAAAGRSSMPCRSPSTAPRGRSSAASAMPPPPATISSRSISARSCSFVLGWPLPAAHRAAGQEPEHHLGRRLPRRPLRQEPGRRRHRHRHRRGRHPALHRPAAEGRGALGRHAPGRASAAASQSADRHGLHHRLDDGDLRRSVRHPPHRRDRASRRPDRRGRSRVARQARRLPGRRLLRHLLHVRRHRQPHRARPAGPARSTDSLRTANFTA